MMGPRYSFTYRGVCTCILKVHLTKQFSHQQKKKKKKIEKKKKKKKKPGTRCLVGSTSSFQMTHNSSLEKCGALRRVCTVQVGYQNIETVKAHFGTDGGRLRGHTVRHRKSICQVLVAMLFFVHTSSTTTRTRKRNKYNTLWKEYRLLIQQLTCLRSTTSVSAFWCL